MTTSVFLSEDEVNVSTDEQDATKHIGHIRSPTLLSKDYCILSYNPCLSNPCLSKLRDIKSVGGMVERLLLSAIMVMLIVYLSVEILLILLPNKGFE